jgi:hypothetical protein
MNPDPVFFWRVDSDPRIRIRTRKHRMRNAIAKDYPRVTVLIKKVIQVRKKNYGREG